MSERLRVGFIGLGDQGAPIARRIIDAGFPTTLWARRTASLAPFSDTAARTVSTKPELGAASDVLCVCVVDDAGVVDVLEGPGGALTAMAAGGVVLVHSTTHPDTCRRLQAAFPQLLVMDAPVSGGGFRAAEGTLLVMVGGDPATLESVRPVLKTFGDPIVYLGPLGSAQEAKLLNNAIFTAQLGLAADLFALGRERGLDLAGLAAVLRDSSGRSYAAEVVAGSGHQLQSLSANAAPLLAKDVAILAELLAPASPKLVRAADEALGAMGVTRAVAGHPSDEPVDRPVLSSRDRRIIALACAAGTGDLPAIDEHVYEALRQGELSVQEINEITLHFAVYCGWPKGSQLEVAVRTQWQRLHAERGEPAPPWPPLPLDDLGAADPAERIRLGQEEFAEVNLVPAPSTDSPYFYAGILGFVFGHVWRRPALDRRDRRLVTVPCVGISEAQGPITAHVTSALGTGDLTWDELQETILEFRAYCGAGRADALQAAARLWLARRQEPAS